MGELITKPDANPIVFALCNLLVAGGLGYFLMGQKKKAIITWVIFFVGGPLTCGFLWLISWVTAFDAYKLGEKLKGGESIGETENALDFLGIIFK